MKTSLSTLLSTTAPLTELDARAREVFRHVVEAYLETGEPVGSRTLSKGGIALSPASIRNTLSDLAELGLLSAPHISAGRMPTHQGLRLFVDGLLEIGDVAQDAKREIEARLTAKGMTFDSALREASNLLSGLAGGAGVVMTPSFEAGVRHVEFVKLSPDQALAVLVFDDGRVENRLMALDAGVTPADLIEASNYLSTRLRGRTLSEAGRDLRTELEAERQQLNDAATGLIARGLAAWAGGENDKRALIVRGQANLLEASALEDLERVRALFEDLEEKEELINLLDNVRSAQGVRIFIGSESKLFSLSGSAVIAAPYMLGGPKTGQPQKVVGAIGVIGPARLNYARIIPLVDYTAKILGRLLEQDRP
ncbi:heat-inducible transcriptional repressor HrcA [Asticcacaulis sp. AND118]|uniref:heat-inducible transcriptional repressor HrcA n=1 Tax=Asticcacaulis sp. AND118 TaxID=2840468 RepID=UPI001CFFE98B|nr:heat-inducible transcriptional repressor HrcA [Asticcacaulis sp. AND118]UDF03510.1 heat-inducible transcriptional repressor HrcA [Asticcacaulis sp. AND118]